MDPLEFFSKYISTLIVILQCPLAFSILTVTPVSVPVHQHIASTHLHNPLLRTGILFPHSMWLPRFVWGEMSSSSITLAEPQPPNGCHNPHGWKQLRLAVPHAMSTRSNVDPRGVPGKPGVHVVASQEFVLKIGWRLMRSPPRRWVNMREPTKWHSEYCYQGLTGEKAHFINILYKHRKDSDGSGCCVLI